MDYAHSQVDKRIKKLVNRLTVEYDTALKELQDKANEYFEKFTKQDAIYRQRVKNGEMTRAEYLKWRKNKMLYSKRYDELIDALANDLTHVDELAQNIINKSIPYSYADAANYSAYRIETAIPPYESEYVLGTGFNIYNYDAVAELIQDHNLLPQPSVNIPKAYIWNRRAINSAMMQGIIQGESIPKIANRLQNVTMMDRNSAIRNARTLHTAAEAKGRQDTYERAEKMGIRMARQWVATHDERTRSAHRELDGVIVELDEPFYNSLGKIMYPSDPNAAPANVYNCRCTIRGVLKDYPNYASRAEDYGDIQAYIEWRNRKPVYKPKKDKSK